MKYRLNKEDQGHAYLKVEKEHHPELLENGTKRVVVRFGSGENVHLALQQPKTMPHPVVFLSQNICRKLGIREGDEVEATIEPDDSPLQFDMPEEFQAVLDTDPIAFSAFNKLTPGNKRSLIYLVQSLRSVDKRIERSLFVASKLRAGIHTVREILSKG